MIDKITSRLIRSQIRRVLLHVWDPIGVKDEPNAHDEYDGYVGEIYGLLVQKATNQEMTARLLYIVQETMGLDAATAEDMQPTVRALREIRLWLVKNRHYTQNHPMAVEAYRLVRAGNLPSSPRKSCPIPVCAARLAIAESILEHWRRILRTQARNSSSR